MTVFCPCTFWGELHWVFVAVCRLSLVAASRDYSLVACVGFSLLWSTGSGALRLQELWHMGLVVLWCVGIPGLGIEPVSPALAGRLLITGPSGKSATAFFIGFLYC